MRLVFMNPHIFAYGRTVSSFLFGRKMFLKYNFFLESYIKDKEKEIAFYIDGSYTSFNINFFVLPRFFAYLELLCWIMINKVNPFRAKIYFNLKKLDPKNDVIFTFSRAIVNISEKSRSKLELNKYDGLIFIHFTHYFREIVKLSKYMRTIPHPIIVAENDLVNNTFFKKYFPFVNKVYQLPNVFGDRFVLKNRNYNKKLNKCLALGTMCPVEDKEFFDFFSNGKTLHPMRKMIYEKHQRFSNEIDSFIKEFKDVKTIKNINAEDPFIAKIVKKILPYVILEKIFPVPQKEYFQFDIVEKYNEYKMFICPEELVGLPSINVFEGMVCQCAYVGIDSPMYANLGMIPGIHYVAYKENDFEDLILKIRYYQKDPDELRKIAEKGYDFVRQNLNRKKIAGKFWNDLEMISGRFSKENVANFSCSFNEDSS